MVAMVVRLVAAAACAWVVLSALADPTDADPGRPGATVLQGAAEDIAADGPAAKTAGAEDGAADVAAPAGTEDGAADMAAEPDVFAAAAASVS
mmetsp:Transcript_59051/g.125203  ORF Transcript_59051/g.125203 Transcript_59051/m.125203 type:complete len:93 (+) Transcript_59051:271-549(+)